MGSRVVALVVAIGLIVAAFAYRNRDAADVAGPDGEITVVCSPEVIDVCTDAFDGRADVVAEAAGATYDRLVAAGGVTTDVDLWVVPGPFATMVAEARQRAARPEIVGETARVGGARVAMAVWKDRAAAMRRSCDVVDITWTCVGQVAGRGSWEQNSGRPEWGLVKAGLPAPDREAAGTVALGAATAGFFGTTDVSSVDLSANDGYRQWLGGLAGGAKPGADFTQMLSAGPAVLDLYVGLEPNLQPLLAAAARGSEATLIYPAPVGVTDVYMVAVGQGRRLDGGLKDRLERGLRDAGWTGRADGLPSAGLLDALRATWRETFR